MFVDASAITAILLEEEEGESLSERIELAGAGTCITSPLAIFEATLAVARSHQRDVFRARTAVMRFLRGAVIEVAAVDEDTSTLSLDAHVRYGKGTGHPARLNFGDCFAYAMAKQHGMPLLYKGDDFSLTDLA